MTLSEVLAHTVPHRLDVLGAFHTDENDDTGPGKTVVLLGPMEPGFWPHIRSSSEWQDKAPDPLDRWSARVISDIADALCAEARFPFTQPAQPFLSWALRTGRAWSSPVHLFVHDTAGLWVSFRGALVLDGLLDIPAPGPSPCNACFAKPCLEACPVQALTSEGYDVPACHAFLNTPDGDDCMSKGCAVRRACPISQTYKREANQSAYHMEQFHK